MPRIDIIDISANNGAIDFGTVAASGVQAVILKTTEGVESVDSTVLARSAQARAAGLKIGLYHYLRIRHGSAQDAAEQATEFLALYRQIAPDLLPALDVESAYNTDPETAPNGPATSAECADAVTSFVSTIQNATQQLPIIYTSDGEWTSMGLTGLTGLAGCPLWLAGYGSSASAPAPWTSIAAWQWSGSAQVPGVSGPCDVSQCDNINLLMPGRFRFFTRPPVLVATVAFILGAGYLLYAKLK